MPNFLTKNTSLQVKDIDAPKGIVTGYFAAFENKDSDGDVIVKGAFEKTIAERGPKSNKPRIKHLLDHSTWKAIGKILELEEDNIGLRYVSQMGTHTLGKDTLIMIQEGLITEHSIGYETEQEEKNEDSNNLLALSLWEGSSLQTWGANPNTPITNVKSLLQETPGKVFDRLDHLIKALRIGSLSDETLDLFEIEYSQTKQAILDFLPAKIEKPAKSEDEKVLNILKSFHLDLTTQ